MKRKDYLFRKCHGSREEGEKNSSCGLGLEGCVEAGLVEVEEGKRGKVQSGKVHSLGDSLHVELSVYAPCEYVCRGFGIMREKAGKAALCSTLWRFRILFSRLWAAIGRF